MARIRIIDDDVEFTANTSAILCSEGHDVRTLDRTEHAMESLLEDKPDVLILDLMFPDNPAAGFELAREIRRNSDLKDLPILMLTGVNQEFPVDFSAADIDADWMPVQDFIEKPANPSILLEKVKTLLAKSSG